MRERNLQIELTPSEVLMQSAANAITSVMLNHPELAKQMPPEHAEAFLGAAMSIVEKGDGWKVYLNKQLVAIQKVQTDEGT